MNIELVNVNITEFLDTVYCEYKKIFPVSDRKTIEDFKFGAEQNLMDFYKITLGSLFIGFITIIRDFNNPYIILDYFAIFSEYQNNGYGSTAIEKLKEFYKDFDSITIEVEKPYNIDSERRIDFFEKIGFKRIDIEFLLGDVTYFPYCLKLSNNKCNNLDVIDCMFQLYKKIYGTEKMKKFCKLIEKVGKKI